jgi:uncharacterized membrane protein HdeD (DUF308 family)
MQIIEAVLTKEYNPLWWLGLVSGILMLMLAFWASQQYIVPKAALLIVWVGFGAMIRGIGEMVTAFRMKNLPPGGYALA